MLGASLVFGVWCLVFTPSGVWCLVFTRRTAGICFCIRVYSRSFAVLNPMPCPKRFKVATTEFRESVRSALTAVATHKLRTALTLLGVLIGVFSIIVVM